MSVLIYAPIRMYDESIDTQIIVENIFCTSYAATVRSFLSNCSFNLSFLFISIIKCLHLNPSDEELFSIKSIMKFSDEQCFLSWSVVCTAKKKVEVEYFRVILKMRGKCASTKTTLQKTSA